MKITGNTVGTTMPRSDWNQTDPSKADYIKNKPTLGAISTKDTIEKTDLSSDVQTTLDKAETAATQIGNKVDKVDGKGLSTNDYTTDEKNKLSGVELGANNYSLPTATTDVLGGIKVGNGLTVDENGVLSVDEVTEETVSGEYTDTDRLDFRREISGTPMYIEIHSNADPSVTYGQSYWIKSGFIFFGENGEVDTEKSYYYVCEDGMNFGYNSAVTSDAIALSEPGSISTLYQAGVIGGFLPDTGDNPVSYTIRLVYGGSSSSGTADTTLGITGAAVGQIGRITAVDSDGKPTAWEPVDLPSGGGENALRLVVNTTTTEDVAQVEFTEDMDGNPLKLKKFIFCLKVPAATGVANAMIGADCYRWLSGADTPQTISYSGKNVQLSTSKTTWWGEICLNIEADGKFAILYKRATKTPYSNDAANSDGGTYDRLDVRYAPYSSGGGIYYFHETIDRIFYKSGSTTVMIPTGTKIKIWGVDA